MPPPQIRAMGHLGAGQGGNLLPMEQWQQGYPGGAAQGLRQPGPQVLQQQPQLGTPSMQVQAAASAVRSGAPVLTNSPNNAVQKQALRQLIQTLRSPQSPYKQQQILSILKSNPRLRAAFIKQRQAQQAQQGTGGNVATASPQ